jgi:hypothetical protein
MERSTPTTGEKSGNSSIHKSLSAHFRDDSHRDQHEIQALIEDYKSMRSYMAEYHKLNYQWLTIIYAASGVLILFSGSIKDRESIILVFPPIFCAMLIAMVFIYSHAQSMARYINFQLRPRFESLINDSLQVPFRKFWSWDADFFEQSGWSMLIIRLPGSVFFAIPLFPAIALLAIFIVIVKPYSFVGWALFEVCCYSEIETLLIKIDFWLIVSTAVYTIIALWHNHHLWKKAKFDQSRGFK